MSKVLIAYATRSRSAGEIASELAKAIRDSGHEADTVDLKTENPAVDDYDAIIIGTGIMAGKWYKPALNFLTQTKDLVQNRKLGLFVTCGDANADAAKARADYIDSLVEANGLTPDLAEAFPGILDLSKNSRHGRLGKFVLKMVSKQRNKGTEAETRIDWDGFNDYRDWDKIRDFGRGFAGLLSQ